MSLQMAVGMGTGTVCVGPAAAATASKLVQSSYLVSARPFSLSAIVSLHLTLQLWTVVTLWEFVAMQRNCCDQEKEKLFKQRKLLKIIADPRVVTAATLPYPVPPRPIVHRVKVHPRCRSPVISRISFRMQMEIVSFLGIAKG